MTLSRFIGANINVGKAQCQHINRVAVSSMPITTGCKVSALADRPSSAGCL